MLFANCLTTGEKVTAVPGSRATCPGCGVPVLAKCGEINVWHWAHEAGNDCDPWSEGESVWHLDWKSLAPRDRCEVVMGPHRADIVGRRGVVIELQHSSLSPAEVREREAFYKEIIWILDASDFAGNISFHRKNAVHKFYWRWPRKWVFSMSQPCCLDVPGLGLFLINKMTRDTPCTGYGFFLDRPEFIKRWVNGGKS